MMVMMFYMTGFYMRATLAFNGLNNMVDSTFEQKVLKYSVLNENMICFFSEAYFVCRYCFLDLLIVFENCFYILVNFFFSL